MSFKVVTTDGATVLKQRDNADLTEQQAQASADERNQRAAEMGLKTRYEAVPA